MPIRRSERARYPAQWPLISLEVRAGAGWRCESCGAEHYAWRPNRKHELARVILAACHVDDPSPENVDRANLAAWCQWCHLAHDLKQRVNNAWQTRRARKAIGDLFDREELGRAIWTGPASTIGSEPRTKGVRALAPPRSGPQQGQDQQDQRQQSQTSDGQGQMGGVQEREQGPPGGGSMRDRDEEDLEGDPTG